MLKALSLHVVGGSRIAIVGGSGSGKSTIFALAMRFYAPRQGRLTLDGEDVMRMDDAQLRRKIAWVQQEPPLCVPKPPLRSYAPVALVTVPPHTTHTPSPCAPLLTSTYASTPL